MFIMRHEEQRHVSGATCCSGYEGASSSRKVSTGKVGLGEPAGSGMEEKSSPLPSLKTGNSHVFGHKGILVLVTGPACFVLKKEGWQIYVKPNNSNNKKRHKIFMTVGGRVHRHCPWKGLPFSLCSFQCLFHHAKVPKNESRSNARPHLALIEALLHNKFRQSHQSDFHILYFLRWFTVLCWGRRSSSYRSQFAI